MFAYAGRRLAARHPWFMAWRRASVMYLSARRAERIRNPGPERYKSLTLEETVDLISYLYRRETALQEYSSRRLAPAGPWAFRAVAAVQPIHGKNPENIITS